jgi:hypothetical protein
MDKRLIDIREECTRREFEARVVNFDAKRFLKEDVAKDVAKSAL